jgi:hypothetical protein
MDRNILNQMPEHIPQIKSLPDFFSNVIPIYNYLPLSQLLELLRVVDKFIIRLYVQR